MRYNATRQRFDLQQRLHVSESDISGREGGRHRKPRYGAERIVHGPIDALAIPEPGFTWPGDLLTLHVKYVGARPRTTKMRGGMIYNGVMGSRDDTAVIVAPRGIIAWPRPAFQAISVLVLPREKSILIARWKSMYWGEGVWCSVNDSEIDEWTE